MERDFTYISELAGRQQSADVVLSKLLSCYPPSRLKGSAEAFLSKKGLLFSSWGRGGDEFSHAQEVKTSA